MKPRKLTEDELAGELVRIDSWHVQNGKLTREFKFRDFIEAFGFMMRVAFVAEKLGHHPEWYNVWGTVRIDLCTHECSGISDKDVQFAEEVDGLLSVDG